MKRITLSFPWPLTAAETQDLFRYFWRVTLITTLLFIICQNNISWFKHFAPGIKWLMWVTGITSAIILLWPAITNHDFKPKKNTKIKRFTTLVIGLISLTTLVFNYRTLGWWGIIMAIVFAAVITSLTWLQWQDPNDPNHDD